MDTVRKNLKYLQGTVLILIKEGLGLKNLSVHSPISPRNCCYLSWSIAYLIEKSTKLQQHNCL